ncbi:MAG: hypothetical protein N3G19_03810 [Candidatus Pacearchaeota archaeon]|nr:hypothetical protein [Candidatus Pacearchaeota archaeon]
MTEQIAFNKEEIKISAPENYEKVEIRTLSYNEEHPEAGYNGNVIIGYTKDYLDVFFLSINEVSEENMEAICERIEEMLQNDNKMINLIVFNGGTTIFNLNEE